MLLKEKSKGKEGKMELKPMNMSDLIEKHSIDEIESGLVYLFVQSNELRVLRNELVLDKIKRATEGVCEDLLRFLELNKESISLKNIERVFELIIEEKERKINGAFYTPTSVVDYIVETTITKDGLVCDPACGSGAFLVSATERLHKLTNKPLTEILENRIYGCDISKRSVERTKLILSLLALLNKEDKEEIKFNLIVRDSLKANWELEFPEVFGIQDTSTIITRSPKFGFDFVIGNPPYVRIQNLDVKTRQVIKKRWLSAYKYNVDLYIPFIELSLKLIKKEGRVSFIVSKSFFDSEAGKTIREILRKNRYIEKILDFNYHQVFNDVITYTAIITLDKQPKDTFEYYKIYQPKEMQELSEIKFRKEKYEDLPEDKIVINGHRDNQNLSKIAQQPIRLGDLYPVKIGVATLSDDLYLLNNGRDERYLHKTYSGQDYFIEKSITRPILLANKIKSKKVKILYDRIIFPYRLKGDRYSVLEEALLKERYPSAYQYLKAIKPELMKRDKGQERVKEYGSWYAYGRVQGYNARGEKLVCPTMMPEPRFELINDEALFIAGYCYLTKKDGKWLIKVLNSNVFWYYITKQAKKIRNEFWVVNKKILEGFKMPVFTEKEKTFLKSESNQSKINDFLIKKYGLLI